MLEFGGFAAFGVVLGGTVAALLAGAAALHTIPRFGDGGKRLSRALCAGVPLDGVVTYFTILPLVVGPLLAGWIGLAAAIVGQYAALILWEIAHELRHWKSGNRARILRATNKLVGPVPNLLAVFWTSLAVPVFWFTRLAEHVVYPPLTWLVGLPKYEASQWVNVTRHKFEGLVGHDRIWCLYCDWMTGVWSLGTEMLRNVESFWCPIRFADPAKCANCSIDFPDVANGWVDFEGKTAADAGRLFEEKYGETDGRTKPRAWFGHPSRQPTRVGGSNGDSTVRLTVNGRDARVPDGATEPTATIDL